MLSKLQVQGYKSLFDATINLGPLTIFIGPNGSGKSNICESLAVFSRFLQHLIVADDNRPIKDLFIESLTTISNNQQNFESKFWHGEPGFISIEFSISSSTKADSMVKLLVQINDHPQQTDSYLRVNESRNSGRHVNPLDLKKFLFGCRYPQSSLNNSLKKVDVYDFSPNELSGTSNQVTRMYRTGRGIAYSLVDILHANRKSFDELEERLIRLVPNVQNIVLPRQENKFKLKLRDRYSNLLIPASDISDGTLRILAFLVALYQENTPSIICFEELENGVHPWLLHKMMELLKIVSTEGITGKPVQVLITTHSPLLLNYVESHQVRAVELDREGKTQVHNLPTDSIQFQKALEAYDGALGELWFTNVFGGNPV